MDIQKFVRDNRSASNALAWGSINADEFREKTNSPELTDGQINEIVSEIWEPKGYISN